MSLRFSKMHGLGNDFVVIDAINQSVSLSTAQVRALSNRHTGIGCDQLLLIEAPRTDETEFFYRIYNADGGEVEQCGNGARCFARYVRDFGLTDNDSIRVETLSGVITLQIESDGQVTVNMGVPSFEPEALPFLAPQRQDSYTLDDEQTTPFGAVSMGNPHTVVLVDSVDIAPVEELGAFIESHRLFPQRVNAGFAQVADRDHMRVRVFERGAGETQACGTGACAAMVIARQQGLVNDTVDVELRGGHLQIHWQGEGEPVWMTGPATHVFEGTIEL